METVANTTLTQPVTPVAGAGKSFFTAKTILLGTGLMTLISLVTYFLISHDSNHKKTAPSQYSFDSIIIPAGGEQEKTTSPREAVTNPLPENRSLPKTPLPVEAIASRKEPASFPSHEKQVPESGSSLPNVKKEDSLYAFPVLTEAQVVANDKRKEKMLVQSVKLSSSKYAFIPQAFFKSEHFNSKGPLVTQRMQTTEVSNIEYKTFLFDLLIRGDYAAFLKAKPDQSLWNTIHDKKLGKYLEAVYFSDKAYNDYPVVNISREGAELYCKWLKEESQSFAEEKNILKEEERDKLYERSYALPTAKDWAYAAEGGEVGNVYPWAGAFMRNASGAYLANFCIQKENEKTGAASSLKNYTSASVGSKTIKDLLTCRVDGFKPNKFGLYNMSGNVAELVVDDSTGQLLAKGGSWNSSPEDLKIGSRETVTGNGASPYHGFRPLITERYFSTVVLQQHSDSTFFNVNYKPMLHYPIVRYPVISYPSMYPVVPDDSAYVFPVLSEAEVKANHKQKKRMVERLMKLQKESYAFIPMGSFLYGKDTFSCRAFYMQAKEVSNLEYRTFLFDLLISGKKTDFLKAKPDQGQWNKKFGKDGYFDPMKKMYFSHPAYNDYPVVNISREGAEMYCIWLSVAVNEALREKGKPVMNDLRLPSDYEWACAASNKANQVRYANGTAQLRSSKGLYLQNFNGDTYANSRYDSIHDVYMFHKTEDGKGPIIDGGFFTTVTGAYTPNLYGIYDLAGNVSEMVYLWDGNSNKARGFGTKGGSWCSPDYFLEIDARQEFRHPEKPSPLVGFRPVMTAMSANKTKP